MPWRETSVMEERLRFVARLLEGEGMSEVCRDFGISRKTGYKIFNRYKDEGLEALTDRSRRPVRYANQLPDPVEAMIVRFKKEKPHWGARKNRELLVRKLAGDMRIPARSTVHAVLDRHGLVSQARKRNRANKAMGTEDLANHRQPVRHEVVTHVLGTNCYLCLRVGHRPQIAEEVIRPLQFRDGQKVVSVVAATSREALFDWIGADVCLSQAIPLPFVARRKGVTAVYPPDVDTAALFNVLGNAVECETKKEYDLLAAASALMATHFGIMHGTTEWLAENGLPDDKGRAYIAPLFAGLSETALLAGKDDHFIDLSRDYATKGGLNEQVFHDFDQNGGMDALTGALDRVLERITKKQTTRMP